MAVAMKKPERTSTPSPERARGGRYRLLGGMFEHGFGRDTKIIKKGGIVQSDTDLRKQFPNMFEKIRDDIELDEDEQSEASNQAPPGTEVTELFPDAEDAGLQVYKDKKNYSVIDKGAPGKPLNEDPLTTKQQVNVFIDNYLAS